MARGRLSKGAGERTGGITGWRARGRICITLGKSGHLEDRRKRVCAQVVEQYRTAEQLHGEEPVFGSSGEELVERDEVRVSDAGDAAEFLLEEVERGGADAAQGLERDRDAPVLIEGFVDHPHAALADFANQSEAVGAFDFGQTVRHVPVLTSWARFSRVPSAARAKVQLV